MSGQPASGPHISITRYSKRKVRTCAGYEGILGNEVTAAFFATSVLGSGQLYLGGKKFRPGRFKQATHL